MKNLSTVTLSILFLFPFGLFSQDQQAQIQQIIEDYLQPDAPGLAVMVTKGDEVVYRAAHGLSDVAAAEKLSPDQLFRIGSITKQFTAVAILQLAHEKKLRLEAPISEYIPNAGEAGIITIKQLLHHTSGFGNQSNLPDYEAKVTASQDFPADMMPLILGSPRQFDPGTAYAYSNLGYIVLGYIIEIVSGIAYEAYLYEHFLKPLEMKETGFEYLDEDLKPRMSKGNSLVQSEYAAATPIYMKAAYSAGGLVSSLPDLAIWNKAVMAGELIPMSYIEQVSESHILPNGQAAAYSMGWQIGNIQGVKSVKHDGIVNGYTSMAIYLPAQDIFVTLLSNCDCYRDIEIPASKVAALVLGMPYPSRPIMISKEKLEAYQGKYRQQSNELMIALHGEHLMYYRKGGPKTKLIPIGENKFLIEGSVDQIEFELTQKQGTFTLSTLSHSTSWERIAAMQTFNVLALSDEEAKEFVGRYQVPG